MRWNSSVMAPRKTDRFTGISMLYTIAVILLVLWVLGLATSFTMGGLIHVLLLIAIVMVVFNLISGRRAL
jgi:hypothetical protein